jgi:hypothetical protein
MLHRGPRHVEAFQPPHAGALPLRQDFLLVGQIVGDGVGAATSHALSSVKRRERTVCVLITGSCLGPSGDGNNSDSENENAPRVFFAAQRKLSSVLAEKSALPHVSRHRQPRRSGPKCQKRKKRRTPWTNHKQLSCKTKVGYASELCVMLRKTEPV